MIGIIEKGFSGTRDGGCKGGIGLRGERGSKGLKRLGYITSVPNGDKSVPESHAALRGLSVVFLLLRGTETI